MTPVSDPQPILVTGSHRSGSTWVGRMLASAPGVGYISEPFSPNHRPGLCRATFPHWFTYICDENADLYREPLRRTLEFRYDALAELRALPASWHGARARRRAAPDPVALGEAPAIPEPTPMPRPGRHLVKDGVAFAAHRARGRRALMKDPMALFSAEWLARELNMRPVVLIRHPAAFAASLLRVGWRFPFDHFLRQPLLMRDHLEPFRPAIEEAAAREQALVDQAALLWLLIHSQIQGYRERHPDWIYATHEELSLDPVQGFRELHAGLGLEFSRRQEAIVVAHTGAGNPTDAPAGEVEALRRNSRATASSWRRLLEPAVVDRLRARVEPLAAKFYSDTAWNA
jgi:hypothetical protein